MIELLLVEAVKIVIEQIYKKKDLKNKFDGRIVFCGMQFSTVSEVF